MKLGSLLVVLAVVLAVIGAGLSYSGYSESLRVSTVTNTQSFTATSTNTIASTRTETSVITTSSTISILDQVIDIQGLGEKSMYCGYYDDVSSTIEPGKVNVSYSSDGGPVDFWMLSEDAFKAYEARHECEASVWYVEKKLYSSSYEFTKDVSTSATYYFVFLNKNKGPVSITLHVDGGMRTEVLTRTKERVDYLTQTIPFVTETVSFSTRTAGLGLLFYPGIGLIIIAGVVLAVSRIKGSVPKPVKPSTVAPVAPSAPAAPAPESGPGKFCVNCGASLPAHATFCNKCGTKQ
jgi:hypothetical protein